MLMAVRTPKHLFVASVALCSNFFCANEGNEEIQFVLNINFALPSKRGKMVLGARGRDGRDCSLIFIGGR
jgi:hypothetical protein